MSKKNEQKWTQIGNYLVGIEENSLGTFMCAKSVSGVWSIRWRDDSYVYSVILSMLGEEKCHSYIESLLTLYFAATNYPHDLVSIIENQETPVMNGFAKLVHDQTAFESSLVQSPTEQADEDALNEVVEMEEIQDELARLDEEVDGEDKDDSV